MKRAEKLTLLRKIIDGKADKAACQHLCRSSGQGAIVIFYQPGDPEFGPNDIVSFNYKGQQVKMPFKDIQSFTNYDPLFILHLPKSPQKTGN